MLEEFKDRYREAVDEIFQSFLSGSKVNVAFEQDVMERLLDLSPPGIDEVMALIEVMELMERRTFDIFVLDTAPTGHLLRFLEMPEIASDWLNAAMKVILRYQGLASLSSVARLVMKYSSQVRRLRQTPLDAAATEIIVVTIPEALGVVEMQRLIEALCNFKIACRQIVINMVTPPNACPLCSEKRDEEQQYIREVIAQCSNHRVVCVSRLPHPIHGLTELLTFREILWGDGVGKTPKTPGIALPSDIADITVPRSV
jgi:arsenite/tail-anchored protein-transporting ATPase